MPSKRLTIPHHWRQARDRRALMTHLLEKTGSKVEVRTLREKHWKPLLRRHPNVPLDAVPCEALLLARYGGLRQGSPATSPGQPRPTVYPLDADSTFIAYLDAIEDFAAHDLRLIWKGYPPSWALCDVHDRVLERPDWSIDWPDNRDFWEVAPTPRLSPTEPEVRTIIEIATTPGRSRVVAIDATSQDVLSVQEVVPVSADVAFDFDSDNWQTRVRDAIAAATDDTIAQQRRIMSAAYAGHETAGSMRRNPDAQQRELKDLDKLASWLSMEIKPDDRTWKRLQLLTRTVLFIDLPAARKTTRK